MKNAAAAAWNEIFEVVNTNVSVWEQKTREGAELRTILQQRLRYETQQYHSDIIGNNLWMHHYLL